MPRRFRISKRRIDDATEARAWRMFFASGHDYLGDLRPFGIESDEEAKTEAAAVWNRFGASFLADYRQRNPRRTPWALRELGEPHAD